ncbi:MAG: hypothetical protein PHD67_07190 [Oscillospiraceae bacterium]|nr:hypothetical protein [Oscillospiraceae bacterium]
MSVVFFPSCKAKTDFPRESERAAKYLRARFGIEPMGCCRAGFSGLGPEDRAIVLCPTCASIVEESSRAGGVDFLWEVIDRDEGFPFPDYHGQAMTVQDCWTARERREVQETVRSLLKKMNVRTIELPENFEKTVFCGTKLLSPPSPANQKLAPRRYGPEAAQFFHPMEKEAQIAYLREYCRKIGTENVVCICKFCRDGLSSGGKRALHLLELLFPEGQASHRP